MSIHDCMDIHFAYVLIPAILRPQDKWSVCGLQYHHQVVMLCSLRTEADIPSAGYELITAENFMPYVPDVAIVISPLSRLNPENLLQLLAGVTWRQLLSRTLPITITTVSRARPKTHAVVKVGRPRTATENDRLSSPTAASHCVSARICPSIYTSTLEILSPTSASDDKSVLN